ncbi:MAG: glycoside hydrolase family 127 protein [Prevotellaceae bacterium]|nr:glycoside hydrolase family 127 protein [Candidatus Minthosoma caballi]
MNNKLNTAIIIGALGLVLATPISAKEKQRTIVKVEPVNVETPSGTVPRLPYQVWVTYSDGTHEWRQTRWTNSLLSAEQQQANPDIYPAGKEYKVQGYIIGDNTSANGYPISASVKVVNEPWSVPANAFKAEPLPLSAVQITGNNRLTNNRDMLIKHLLELDITQQLYNYRDTYGLPTEGYTESDGWDSPTTKLKGHGTGHYMSALAFAYASAQDASQKKGLLRRMEIMVNELRECQERTFVYDETLGRYREARDYAPEAELLEMKGTWDAMNEHKKDYAKYGYGYINAIPASHCALIEKYSPYNNEQGVWAPYYTVHKQLAGLIDIANVLKDNNIASSNVSIDEGHLTTQQISDKALQIAKDMGLWVWNRMHYRTYIKRDGTKGERQAKPGNRYEMWNMYIAGEVGGMAESLSRLSEMVNDPSEKAHLLEAANCFDTPALFDPVSKNIDDIRTRHANQHIPMFVGALRSYLGNNNHYYYNLAYNFWNMIQGRYVYAMGGVGNGEMWRQPYTQMLSMNTSVMSDRQRNMFPNPDINETCCVYNLLKLTKDLNCFDPDDARYMDYYERGLYNQIVGSVHPTNYGVCYQYAVGMDAIKPFGSETPQSTCCGGTGSENHVKYQEAAYFVNDNTIWIGLYIPSIATWSNKNVQLTQECKWPAEHSTIKVNGGKFAMKLRVPYWATQGFDIKLNGKSLAKSYQPCSYFEIAEREWSENDVVEVIMPFTKHINFGPDKMEIAATGKNETSTRFSPEWVGTLMYGPLAMATPDIHNWNEAEFKLNSNLSNITLNGASSDTGFNGNLYTLTLNTTGENAKSITFQPDYYHTGHSTHYLRLNVATTAKKSSSSKPDFTALDEALQVAQERIDAQNAWNALEVKVPAHAPWAENGYSRMVQAVSQAKDFKANATKSVNQEDINAKATLLNVAINSMRPGNLAEPEDLQKLLPLLDEKKHTASKSTELREAIDYAEMVISYVNDGSGTKDLILKAIERLNSVSK